jgi:hypothetical protein
MNKTKESEALTHRPSIIQALGPRCQFIMPKLYILFLIQSTVQNENSDPGKERDETDKSPYNQPFIPLSNTSTNPIHSRKTEKLQPA